MNSQQLAAIASNSGSRFSRRRFLEAALGTAALGTFAALPACSSSSSSQGEKMTIEVWVWETEKQWQEVEQRSGLDKHFPNVTFKWTALPIDQLHQKALSALGAGLAQGLPSIIRTSMPYYRAFVNTGNLMDVTDKVTPYQKDILPDVWQGALVGDKVYQVPDDTGVQLFGYREDLFRQAGLPTRPDEVADLIKTYDDLLNVGHTLQQKTGVKLFNEQAGDTFNNLILQDSTGFFDKDGNVIFDSDYHVEVATISKKIWDSGLTTHYTDNSPQMWQAYQSGQLATQFYPNWQDFEILYYAPATKGKWVVTKLPSVMTGGRRASTADGVCQTIPNVLPDEQKQVALQVSMFLRLTKQATLAHMQTFSGAFVSYIPGLDAMTNVPSPVLDNQYTYKVFLDAANSEKILPWYRTSVFFSNAQDAVNNALFKILQQNAPIQPTLKSAADSIRQLQASKNVK
jgi:ABC-type glycerol-3-phosphate transport system substrate-binding protein